MSQMVGMSLQDGEPAIDLFEQKDTRQLMGDSHFSKGQGEIGLLAGSFAESIGRANRKNQRNRALVLMVTEELCQFFRRELLTAGVEQDQVPSGSSAIPAA